MLQLRLRLFGHGALSNGSSALNIAPLPKCLSALAYLALNSDRAVARRELAFALWPDVDEEAALGNLRRHTHALLNELPPSTEPWLVMSRTAIAWNSEAPWSSDVQDFDRYLSSPAHRHDAIELYSDELLVDTDDEWIVPYRERYKQRASEALAFLSVQHWMHHHIDRGIEYARHLLKLQPFDENALRRAMAMLYQNGDRAGALKLYADFEARLDEELSTKPMASTTALADAIRANANAVPFPTNLPAHLTPFLGREAELSKLGALFETTRLLTLVGTGGIGKTRLALQLAALQAALYHDGVFLADFSYTKDGEDLARIVAESVGAPPAPDGGAERMLQTFVQKKSLLIIFDNCEHVIDGSARLCERLLKAAPHVRIVATSREALRLNGEVTWRVPPLDEADAHALFAERAPVAISQGANDAALTAEICAHVDGLPLAIELAAAATGTMTLEELLAQLRSDVSVTRLASRGDVDRHRTLRATVEWGFQLLDPAEQSFMMDLTIFNGSWTVEAAQAVCGGRGGATEAVLQRLADRSMVQFANVAGTLRYRLLETIRVYVAERRKNERDGDDLAASHARFYRQLAIDAEPHYRDEEQAVWLERLHLDLENIRRALTWSFSNSPPLGASFVRALRRFFEIRGYYAEGKRWLEMAIAAEPASVTDRIDCLNSLGNIEAYSGTPENALARYAAAEDLARSHDYRKGLLHAMMGRAYVVMHRVGYEEAWPFLQQALSLLRETPDEDHAIATTLGNIAFIEMQRNELAAADTHYREALELFRRLGDRRQTAWISFHFGRLAFHRGDFAGAQLLIASSLDVRTQFGDRRGVIESTCGLADIAFAQGATDRAVGYFVQASRLSDEIGWKRGMALTEEGLAAAADRRGASEEAASRYEAAKRIREEFNVPAEVR
jgi:predicted ATPase